MDQNYKTLPRLLEKVPLHDLQTLCIFIAIIQEHAIIV